MRCLKLIALLIACLNSILAQSIGGGAVSGTVLDPANMVVPSAQVQLRNASNGFNQTVPTTETGTFRFNNVPPDMYELAITAPGFEVRKEQVEVRDPVPINLSIELKMAGVTTSVDVQASAALIDTDPSAHTDANASLFLKLRASTRHPA
jgi:hypothetical protein